MKQFLNITLTALVMLPAGCATPSRDTAQNSGPTETCHVCKFNYDLACVCVRLKDSTPRTEYQGITYYFCSDDCRAEFVKQPDRYLPKPAQNIHRVLRSTSP
ncbi:MAG: YHS domain-containing protein [Pedosphaera sp.]|nr:YHS domain-containing protein [Pedosphaera sp.]